MLNRGVHPVVPQIGSVGASDLMHLAAIALVATGLGGRAEVDGELLPGPDAMRRAGLAPARLEPKDGLAVISANAVSIGHGALVAARAVDDMGVADLTVAASMEAIGGNPSIVDPLVGRAKGIAGQIESADRIRRHLAGSDRWAPGAPASVQDPLSFRVAPQVHGACREVIRFLADSVEQELAACDDNPLVARAERRLISNGNFHPMVLALAVDALRPALAHVGLLSDRRMGHLWAAAWQDPVLLEPDGMREVAEAGGALLRYAAAARFTELRALAAPVTLDVPPLDIGVEDHATNAPLAVLRTEDALDRLEDVLAVELLMAHESLRRRRDAPRLGNGVQAALDMLAKTRASLGSRPPSDVLHATVRGALRSSILPAAEAADRS
jgi:histidine ammonia-lyase